MTIVVAILSVLSVMKVEVVTSTATTVHVNVNMPASEGVTRYEKS